MKLGQFYTYQRAQSADGRSLMKVGRTQTTPLRMTRWSLLSGLIISVLLLIGCDWNPADDLDDLSIGELTAVLENLILADESISIEGLDDSDYQEDESYSDSSIDSPALFRAGALPDTLRPSWETGIRWRRRIDTRDWYFELDTVMADTAYATITRNLAGSLIILVWTRDTTEQKVVQDTLNKPFNITSTRRVLFARTGTRSDVARGWRVAGRTAILGTAGGKVSLESISLIGSDGTTTDISRESVLNTFYAWSELPQFQAGDTLSCYVQIDNTGPTFPLWFGERVIVRRVGRLDNVFFTSRTRLADDGRGEDQVAWDDIFSGRLIVNRKPDESSVFRLFAEVTDLASFFIPAEEYHCEFIGFPYLVDD